MVTDLAIIKVDRCLVVHGAKVKKCLPALRAGRRAAGIISLIQSALCRMRHKADHAERRTMPNGINAVDSDTGNRRLETMLLRRSIRHSTATHKASRKCRRRSDGLYLDAGLCDEGRIFASAASLIAICA